MITEPTNDAQASDVLHLDRAPLTGGHWVTIDGEHVYIKGDRIVAGGGPLKGKTLGEAHATGHSVTAVHGANHPVTGTPEGPADADLHDKARADGVVRDAQATARTAAGRIAAINHIQENGNNKRVGSADWTFNPKAGQIIVAHSVSGRSMGTIDVATGQMTPDRPGDGPHLADVLARVEEVAKGVSAAAYVNRPSLGIRKDGEKTAIAQQVPFVASMLEKQKREWDIATQRERVITDRQNARKAARARRKFNRNDVAPFSREDEPHGVYLSVDAAMAPAVVLGQGFPTTFNELPVHYRDVQATVCGRYTHPVTGQHVEITPTRVKNIARNVTAMLARKVDVPASATHKFADPRNTLGNVFAAREKGGELVLTVGYYGDAALDVARKNKVSLGLCSNYVDALGNTYDDTINHLAVTPVPVLPGLPGFVTLSREPNETQTLDDSSVVQPPADAGTKGVDMFDPATKARIAQFTGADVGDDVNAVMAAVLAKAEPATAQVATLSRERDELKSKVTNLSTEPADDPRYAGLAYRTLRAEVDADVAKGDYSRHTGDAYLSLYEVEKGKPNVTLLSREDDDSPLAPSRIRELLKLARPGLRGKGEATGIQTTQLLSREVPDADPTDDLAAIGQRQADAMVASKLASLPK